MARRIKIRLPGDDTVSGLIDLPSSATCLMVLAHGAGAGMEHIFMSQLADALASHHIGSLRFNFRYMERGGGRPDYPNVAHQVIRAAIDRAHHYADPMGIPVVGGGKSFGGRMLSQVAAKDEDPGVSALVFYGFPLHAPGKPGSERAAHLQDVRISMLFLQGTRDTLAQEPLIRQVCKDLRRARLCMFEGADHGFHMLKRSGVTDLEMRDRLALESAKWLSKKLK